ncbi:hypothetical protein, partial [Mycoplasma todarodis]
MNKKSKTAIMAAISLASLGTIGVGTAVTLKKKDNHKSTTATSFEDKKLKTNLPNINTPKADSLTYKKIKEIEKNINDILKKYVAFNKKQNKFVPVKLLDITKTLKVKKGDTILKKELEDFLGKVFNKNTIETWREIEKINSKKIEDNLNAIDKKIKEINKKIKHTETNIAAKTKVVKSLNEKLLVAKENKRTAKDELDKATQALDKENAKTPNLVKISKDAKAAQDKATQAVSDAKAKLDAEVAKTADLNKKLSDAKTNEATAKDELDKATQALADEKAK